MSRQQKSLARRPASRRPSDSILIVCEGSKTEPLYLEELRHVEEITSARIVITGSKNTDPLGVVKDAIARFKKEPEYDRVYCVFDKDAHASYHSAKILAQNQILNKKVGNRPAGRADLIIIDSIPCFEIWLILHFKYSSAPHKNFDSIKPHLLCQSELSNYAKGNSGLYSKLKSKIEAALANTDRLNLESLNNGSNNNPSTQINRLVRDMWSLKKQ